MDQDSVTIAYFLPHMFSDIYFSALFTCNIRKFVTQHVEDRRGRTGRDSHALTCSQTGFQKLG